MKHKENRPFEYSASITQFYYSTPNIPALFIPTGDDATISTNVDCQIKGSSEDKTLFLDEVSVHIEARTNASLEIFSLNVVISAVVNILDENIDEKSLVKILTVIIPQEMYDSLNPIVRNFHQNTGYPPFDMQDYSFADQHPQLAQHRKADSDIPS